MAKVLTAPTSGSIGGTTFSRNRNGQYIRQRSMPTQPRTTAQVAQRARLADAATAWRGLSSAQRAAWTAFGNSFKVVNSLGQSNNMTGLQAYVKVNTVNSLNGGAQVTAPPALPSFVPLTITGMTATAGVQLLQLTGTSPAAGTTYMVYAAAQKSAGVTFVNNYKFLASFTVATAGEFTITAQYTAAFGALVIGKQVFVKVVQSQAGMQDNGTVFSTVILT